MTERFIELNYTGRVDGVVFDTTRAQDAPQGAKATFQPAVIKIGSGQLIKGLDSFLADKGPGDYSLTLSPQEAFGMKDSKLLKLVPVTAFGKEAKQLEPGMSVRFGEQQGVVKSISGGRVVVDFNHPLAGKTVEYSLTVLGEVSDPKKKVESMLRAFLGVTLPVDIKEGKAVVSLPKGFPAEGLLKELEKQTGVAIEAKEVDLGEHSHSHDGHDHNHSHSHSHDHDGHDHSHEGHSHSHEGHEHSHKH